MTRKLADCVLDNKPLMTTLLARVAFHLQAARGTRVF